jgi:hypothetical protein
MKIIKILVLTLLLCNVVLAQETKGSVKVTMSDEYENTNNNQTFVDKMLRDQNGNTIIIKKILKIFGRNKTIIEAYDPKMELIYSDEMEIDGVGDKELEYVGAYSLGGQPFVASSYYNKDKGFRYLFFSKIQANGKLSKPQKVSEYPTTLYRDGSFELVFAQDSSKLLIINKIPTRRSESETFSFVTLDKDFKEIWKGKASLPYENRDVVLSDYAIDDDANVFVLATVDFGNNSEGVLQEIFEYKNGASASKRYKINLRDKIVNRLRMLPDKEGNIVCVGQYSSMEEKANIFRRFRTTTMGTLYFKIDTQKDEIVGKTINQFNESVFGFFEVRPSRVAKGIGVDYLTLMNVWMSESGNIFMDFEREYFITNYNYQNRNSTTTYYSQSGLVVRMSPEGKIAYETVIPKAMTSTNDKTGLNHLVSHKNDEVYYVYNDSARNLKSKIESISDVRSALSPEGSVWIFGDRRPTVICCKINDNGGTTFTQLFNFRDDDVFLNTENSLQYDKNSFIVIASYFKYFKLAKLEF